MLADRNSDNGMYVGNGSPGTGAATPVRAHCRDTEVLFLSAFCILYYVYCWHLYDDTYAIILKTSDPLRGVARLDTKASRLLFMIVVRAVVRCSSWSSRNARFSCPRDAATHMIFNRQYRKTDSARTAAANGRAWKALALAAANSKGRRRCPLRKGA